MTLTIYYILRDENMNFTEPEEEMDSLLCAFLFHFMFQIQNFELDSVVSKNHIIASK